MFARMHKKQEEKARDVIAKYRLDEMNELDAQMVRQFVFRVAHMGALSYEITTDVKSQLASAILDQNLMIVRLLSQINDKLDRLASQ